ncbi:MAG: GAF domain-containing protein [Aggregatilineales bacterium]
MSERLSTPVNLDAMLDQILERMHEVVPFDGGGIAVYDAASGLLAPRRYRASRSDAPLPRLLQLGEGVVGRAAQSRQPVLVDDVSTNDDYLPYDFDTRSQLAVPMVLGDELLGVLSVESHEVAAYTPQHQTMLCALADQTALALHITRLYETLAERYARLNEHNVQLVTRNEISRLAAGQPLDGTSWQELAQRLAHLGMAEGGALTLWDEAAAQARLLAIAGFDELDHLDWNNLTRKLAGQHRPMILNNAWSLDMQHVSESENGIRAILALPLTVRGRFIGAAFLVSLSENRPFTNTDIEQVASALDQIALAIDNQALLQNLHKQLGEMATLLEIAGVAASNRELDPMLSQVLQLCQKTLNISAGAILIHDPKTDVLLPRISSSFGFSDQVLAMAHFPIDDAESQIVTTFRTGQGRFVNNLPVGIHEKHQEITRLVGLPNMLYAPLHVQHTSIGVILVGGKPCDFSQNDLDLLTAIGSHVAAALRNAELLDQMRHRLRETEALQRIAAITSATLDLDDMIERAVTEAAELLEAAGAFVLMPDSSSEWLIPHMRSLYGISRGQAARPLRIDDTGPLAAVYTSGELYIERRSASENSAGSASLIACPLSSHNRMLGVLVVRNGPTGDFETVHVDLLRAIASQIAVSMENAGLFAAERRRADLMSLINQIGQELTATLDLPGLTRKAVRSIHELLGYDAVCLYLLDESGITVTAQASAARTAAMRIADGFSFPITQGFVGRAVRTEQVQLTPNVLGDPDFFWPTREHQAASDLALPLRSREHIVGALEIVSSHINDFQEADRTALETLATQISTAIENARLWDQAQRRLLEQGIVHQIGQDLTSILEYDELISAVVRHMTRALDTALCLLVSYDLHQNQMAIEAEYRAPDQVSQLGPRRVGQLPDTIERTLIDRAINSRRPAFYYLDEVLGQLGQTAPLNAPGLNAGMALPMIAGDRVTGCMIWLETRGSRRFSESDLRLAQTLTTQAAIAIENARLYRQAQRQAHEQALLYERERRRISQLEKVQASNRLLAGQLNAETLIQLIISEAGGIFEAHAVSLSVPSAPPSRYLIRASSGLSEAYLAEREIEGDWDEVDRARYIPDLRAVKTLSPGQIDLINAEKIRSVLIIPINKGTQHFGLLTLYSKGLARQFAEEEIELAQLFAGQAAVALENARLFTELEDRAVELAKANRLKSEFLARVSHELRTPMNSINGYSDMLLREQYGTLTEKQADRIERIWRNGRNLLALIDDLLDISKIDAGKMELHIEPLDLPGELRATLEALEAQAVSRGLYLHVNVSPDLPPVLADSMRLRQVVTNLLGNAIKFTKTGGVTIEAHAGSEDKRPVVYTRVIDTGIGIKIEDQAIIFDEFRQVDGSVTREYGGTGLGLAITKKLLELMDGQIWVESEFGRGSVFTFVLPTTANLLHA